MNNNTQWKDAFFTGTVSGKRVRLLLPDYVTVQNGCFLNGYEIKIYTIYKKKGEGRE